MICNNMKGKLELESVNSVGEDILSWGYTQLGITDSAGEVRLCRGNLNSVGELCYSLFVGEINPVREINPVDEVSSLRKRSTRLLPVGST